MKTNKCSSSEAVAPNKCSSSEAIAPNKCSSSEAVATNNFNSRAAVFALVLAASTAHAQSESSLAASVGGLSEASATVIGGALGAGLGLTVGSVEIVGNAAALTIVTAAVAGSEAGEVTFSVPHKVAKALEKRTGAVISARKTENGTMLECDEVDIAFVPDADATASADRTPL
jgi:hypothetical protein